MTAAISLQNVSKRYGSIVALDDVSFDVPTGSVCALLGANGAGKSTTLKILLGLVSPDSGTARVGGLDSQLDGIDIRRAVGYVPERPSLYEWMTVDEIGWFVASLYPSDYQRQYQKLLERYALNGRQKIRDLSKGSRSKVALALALAHQPAVLILDEPTSGLDPLVRREFLESMVDVAAEGRTVIISSHQVQEVERVADRVAILLHGKLVCHERLDELKQSAREVSAILAPGATIPPDIPGEVLAHLPMGFEHVWLVRDLNELEWQSRCQNSNTITEIRQPDLEDLLLLLLREYRKRETNPQARGAKTEARATS
jgi:ABC-2 type transport system ATP-binding protein